MVTSLAPPSSPIRQPVVQCLRRRYTESCVRGIYGRPTRSQPTTTQPQSKEVSPRPRLPIPRRNSSVRTYFRERWWDATGLEGSLWTRSPLVARKGMLEAGSSREYDTHSGELASGVLAYDYPGTMDSIWSTSMSSNRPTSLRGLNSNSTRLSLDSSLLVQQMLFDKPNEPSSNDKLPTSLSPNKLWR
ncbi:hypothetical protein IWQ62_001866 [Dispira parvispora]|uniref:Uncharacterized protein n=1 Tax=Dispira parvispora TaxID=1520584 RepID=A0A9W8E7R4_9FUNG|nr:hypothetical protein IWQ62_001866 [Dispira parvispora]